MLIYELMESLSQEEFMQKIAAQTITPPKSTAQSVITKLTELAGITINGPHPYDIQVHNPGFYQRVLHEGPLGLGESYMDKWWDCERLDIFTDKVLTARLDTKITFPLRYKFKELLSYLINYQTKNRAKKVARHHYDLGNDLFKAMLDKNMIYSCAYWPHADTLDTAQIAKLDLVCRKLQLRPGMRMLDVGCGWGGLAKYAAENYGVSVVGVTISEQQYTFAKEFCKGLPVEIRLQDYRDLHEQFDCAASVGMFEHVGHLNYSQFMQTVYQCLPKGGLFLLHTIGSNETSFTGNEWTSKYIFPNGLLPSIALIGKAIEKLFVLEDWHSFGTNYDKTLMAWYNNFVSNWKSLQNKYDERFFRMWRYYLLQCAGAFRARHNELWQIVLSKDGVRGGYESIR